MTVNKKKLDSVKGRPRLSEEERKERTINKKIATSIKEFDADMGLFEMKKRVLQWVSGRPHAHGAGLGVWERVREV